MHCGTQPVNPPPPLPSTDEDAPAKPGSNVRSNKGKHAAVKESQVKAWLQKISFARAVLDGAGKHATAPSGHRLFTCEMCASARPQSSSGWVKGGTVVPELVDYFDAEFELLLEQIFNERGPLEKGFEVNAAGLVGLDGEFQAMKAALCESAEQSPKLSMQATWAQWGANDDVRAKFPHMFLLAYASQLIPAAMRLRCLNVCGDCWRQPGAKRSAFVCVGLGGNNHSFLPGAQRRRRVSVLRRAAPPAGLPPLPSPPARAAANSLRWRLRNF